MCCGQTDSASAWKGRFLAPRVMHNSWNPATMRHTHWSCRTIWITEHYLPFAPPYKGGESLNPYTGCGPNPEYGWITMLPWMADPKPGDRSPPSRSLGNERAKHPISSSSGTRVVFLNKTPALEKQKHWIGPFAYTQAVRYNHTNVVSATDAQGKDAGSRIKSGMTEKDKGKNKRPRISDRGRERQKAGSALLSLPFVRGG